MLIYFLVNLGHCLRTLVRYIDILVYFRHCLRNLVKYINLLVYLGHCLRTLVKYINLHVYLGHCLKTLLDILISSSTSASDLNRQRLFPERPIRSRSEIIFK